MHFSKKVEAGVLSVEFSNISGRGNRNTLEILVLKREVEPIHIPEVFIVETSCERISLRGKNWMLKKEGEQFLLIHSGPEPSDVALENSLRFVLALEYPKRGGILIHSSSAGINGKGVCFVGKSDAGKTTVLKLLKRFTPFNDDLNILYLSEGEVHLQPLPRVTGEISFPTLKVETIFLLVKGNNDLAKKLKRSEAYPEILSCVPFVHYSRETLEKTLEVLKKILDRLHIYRLEFTLYGRCEEEILRVIEAE